MLVDADWLRRKAESDPDCEVEGGAAHPEAPQSQVQNDQEALAQLLVDVEWEGSQPGFDHKPASWKAKYMARAAVIMKAGFGRVAHLRVELEQVKRERDELRNRIP